ncbi:hypothetical protein Q673_01565 [Marinobacter sp. EN3]|uniref:hypothetical protein n=1 Tax=Marinobacter sp. EN3 TaxID=1397533 RepID=UPI0003B8C9FC|nr:hypothetical protein [Marinobacter sp. EN3]ERS12328.1 hypothetical protein Q673_01565 [Marinobacter sp. EN3]
MRVLPGSFYRSGKEYLSISEASYRAQAHPFTLYDAIAAEELEVIEVAGCKAISAEDLERWMMEGGE